MPYLMMQKSEPIPFYFLSKDYAREKNGAKVSYYNYGQMAYEWTGHPVGHCIDGNRQSYCQLNAISDRTDSDGVIRFDLTVSMMDEDDRIDIITLECDPKYPVDSMLVTSYSDANYSVDEVTHYFSIEQYTGSEYKYGVNPRVDSISLGKCSDPSLLIGEGLSGRYTVIVLDNAIDSDHPYVEIRIKRPGRNYFGKDASIDWGIMDGESGTNGPTVITSDPNPSTYGINNNHYKLDTTGKSAMQYTIWTGSLIRPNDEYVLQFYNKMIPDSGFYGSNDYQVQIAYFDENYSVISTPPLYANDGSAYPSWSKITLLINYKDGDKRYSGDLSLYTRHLVPSGTSYIAIRFTLYKTPGYNNIWKLDDFFFHRGTIPESLEYHTRDLYNGSYKSWMSIYDPNGIVKIRRIGMFKYMFATSRQKNRSAHIYDIGSRAFINPQAMGRGLSGVIENRDINGTILGTFTPKAGMKKRKNITMMCTAAELEYLEEIASGRGLIGMIDPQCEWSEYVISPNSMSFNVIEGVTDDTSEYHWTGTMQLEET